MFCPNCGKEIPDNAVFCVFCQARVNESDENVVTSNNVAPVEPEQPAYVEPKVENKPATIALVCGICALGCSIFGFIFGILWIVSLLFDLAGIGLAVTSFIFVSKASKIGKDKKATAGLICAIIGVVLSGIGLIACVGCAACVSCGLSSL